MSDLPENWCKLTVGDVIADAISGAGFGKEYQGKQSGKYPFAKVGDISRHFRAGIKYINTADHYIDEEIRQKLRAKVFPKGTVVFAKIGEALKNNYRVICSAPMLFDNNVMGLVPDEQIIDNKYFYYLLTTKDFGEFSVATAVPSVRRGDVEAISVPLPPLNEQKRIVAKIEELFSELDSGIESLKTARAQLKVYRQAVLKHAFEGKLTAAWREKNKDKLESAEQFLAHIKRERDAEGKRIGKKKLKEPRPLSAEDFSWLFPVPEGWCWERLGWMTCGIEYGTGAKSSETGEIPVLRMGNIQNMKFDWDDLVYTSDAQEISDYLLHEGDVLFNRTNSPELVGKTAIYKGERPAIFAGYLMRINQISSIVDPRFLNFYLNSHTAKQYGNQVKTDGVNQSNINGEKLAHYPFPYCSLEEQRIIVELLEEQMSSIDRTEADIDYQLQKSEALRQSILKKAFSGQLVAQDANDEPASALLARIRTEKTGVKPAKTSKKAAKKSPARAATIIAFPNTVASITTTDLHAGIIGLAYSQHEQNPRMLNTFGHVKAEKISHLVEYHLGIPLGRAPVKDAAGPNDYRHLKKVEHRANMANWFSVQQRPGGEGYVFAKKRGFDGLIAKTSQALGEKAAEVEALIRLLLPLNTQQAEIVATLYAAWNNLLIAGSASPSDEEIVTEARENWHESKLNIERERFFRGLEWLRKKQLTPKGMGTIVDARTGAA